MTTIPQAVTERYISNLIHYGRNKEFDIVRIERRDSIVGETHVGFYFSATVEDKVNVRHAVGATIAQTIRRCLEAHGVTFR